MKKTAYIVGTERIEIFEASLSEIPLIMELENDKENRNFIWQGTQEEHLNEINDENHFLWIFRTYDGTPIGYSLSKIDRNSEVFELRRIAISEKGRGYGREALGAIIKYAFEECNVNRFWLDVYPDNHVGIKLYESFGMHRDGTLRQSYKSERGYLDQIIYSLLKKEYFDGNLESMERMSQM